MEIHLPKDIFRVGLLALVLNAAIAAKEKDPEIEEKIKVVEKSAMEETVVVQADKLEEASNLSLALQDIPGFLAVRRSQNSAEPVIRGLGWERIQTQINGAPQYGACPGRMDPPATLFSAGWVEHVEIVKGLSSVQLGSGGTAGRLMIDTDFDRGDHPGKSFSGLFRSSYLSEREGYDAGIGFRGGTDQFDFKVGYSEVDMDDYSTPFDLTIPSSQKKSATYLGIGFRPKLGHRLYFSAITDKDNGSDFPALPMNTDQSQNDVFLLGYRAIFDGHFFISFSAKASVSEVDHLMSNRGKSTRMMMESETASTADSSFASFEILTQPDLGSELVFGVDHHRLQRDALRARKMVGTGMTFSDHLWPDVEQRTFGFYTEWRHELPLQSRIRIGARADRVESEAGSFKDPSLGGKTIEAQWLAFNGENEINRIETNVAGNVLFSRQWSDTWNVTFGMGGSNRPASMTERYYAFAPAPNGFQVGNPGLRAETKQEAVFECQYAKGKLSFSGSTYFHRFDDFIHPTILAKKDMNGDGVVDLIRGFRNIDAQLFGFEFSGRYQLNDTLFVPIALAYVDGTNRTDDTNLAEIPPLEGRMGVVLELHSPRPLSCELEGRFVHRQNQIDTDFGENETSGFAVYRFKLKSEIRKGIDVLLDVQNLFNREYIEHLNREVAVPVGDLISGQEIPQPGRSFHLAIAYRF